ncbi:MAG: hypothetical protein GX811_00175 [Lentisphaerae bacterium]|nr:hypothetical protein [Lentisphaerota bacterium]
MTTKIRIKSVNGVARLEINGKVPSSITYHNRQNDFYEYMKQFADTGTELFFSYYVRNWLDSWDEHFLKVGNQLDAIFAFNPQIKIVLGLYLSAPAEWAKANPDELCRLKGKPSMEMYRIANTEKYESDAGCTSAHYSFTSEKFDEVTRDHVNRTLDFLDNYPLKDRVIGMFFGGGTTHEWNPYTPDPGPTAKKAFINFLTKKYKTDARLQKAWNDPNAKLDTVRPPTDQELNSPEIGYYFDPAGKGKRINDWHLALADSKTNRILNAGRAIKARRPELITGCFHGNHYKDDGLTLNILNSDAIDFLVSPPQYHSRCPGQHIQLNQVTDALNLRGKLYFSEEDIFPYDVELPYLPGYVRYSVPGDAKDLDDTIAVIEKGMGHTIAKNTMAWYYHFQDEFFKREKRYFQANTLLNKIATLNIRHKTRSNAEILVITDSYSHSWVKPGNRLAQKQIDRELTFELGYIGAPYDCLFLESLEEPGLNLSQYKLIYFLSSQMANAKHRKIINKLKSDGRTLLFGHGAGFISETKASVENMKNFTGFDFEQLNLELAATVTLIDTDNKLNEHLPTGYTFGQSYRAKRLRNDTKKNALFPPPLCISPIFAVADKASVDIGFYNLELPPDYKSAAKTRGSLSYGLCDYKNWPRYFVGLALKEHENWNGIYAGTTTIPTAFLRAVCKYAGVHLYLDTEDVLYTNNKFMALHTNEYPGKRQITLPKKTNVYDLRTGKILASKTNTFSLDCQARRTHLLWLDNKQPDMTK